MSAFSFNTTYQPTGDQQKDAIAQIGIMQNNAVKASLAYRDTYVTQSADKGTCQTYTDNPACTLVSHQCAFYSEEGACLHEYATYSCESKTSGKVMVCGGDVFCLDGECDKAQSGQSNDFAEAVSQLAALAAAGKDVAALNGGGMSVLSPVRRNFVRRLQPDTATAVRTAAGDRISGWPNAAVMKRPWLKQNQTN